MGSDISIFYLVLPPTCPMMPGVCAKDCFEYLNVMVVTSYPGISSPQTYISRIVAVRLLLAFDMILCQQQVALAR